MVALHAVRAGKAMSLEPSQLVTAAHHTDATTGVHHSVLHILCIDLKLRLDAQQYRVVHDVHPCQEV